MKVSAGNKVVLIGAGDVGVAGCKSLVRGVAAGTEHGDADARAHGSQDHGPPTRPTR